MTDSFLAACELKCKVRRTSFFLALSLTVAMSALAQEHAPASQPATADAEHVEPAAAHATEHSITDMILGLGWPIANFIIFVGVIYYFGNGPLKEYFVTRSAAIRKDLLEAAALQASAQSQLDSVEQKLSALPGELTALRARGAEEIAAEEKRIASAAEADRERLLEQTRRAIDLQVRLAKKDILEHAADLSVRLATERIKQETTPADQARLVDRYIDQVKPPQASGLKPQVPSAKPHAPRLP